MKFTELSINPIPYNETLNPVLWDGDSLKTDIRYRLMLIANHFQQFVNIKKPIITDITISGSNASYGYSEYSDIDLHIVVKMDKKLSSYYTAKKNEYNTKYNIKIKNIDVELYVQDKNQPHFSAGIYSIMHDKWITKPKHTAPKVSDQEVEDKAKNYAGKIITAMKSKDLKVAEDTLEDIYKLRKAGLESGGEGSVENLAFKLLRSYGGITNFRKFIDKLQSDELSLKEKTRNIQ
jgi:hypothetical protein